VTLLGEVCAVVTSLHASCWRVGEEASWKEREALCTHNQVRSHLRDVHSDWSYECTHHRVDLFCRGTVLPDRSELGVTATTLCHLQLCTVFGGSASKLSAPHYSFLYSFVSFIYRCTFKCICILIMEKNAWIPQCLFSYL